MFIHIVNVYKHKNQTRYIPVYILYILYSIQFNSIQYILYNIIVPLCFLYFCFALFQYFLKIFFEIFDMGVA